jgi:hypothetical protein
MTRPMTLDEKIRFKSYFPNLDVDTAVVSGEATPAYNCIAWTVGVTNNWLWPGSHISDFDKFYKKYGLVRSAAGPVAAWGLVETDMTHGSISGAGHGPRWESKCGADLRIQHGRTELEGTLYGHIITYYAPVSLSEFASEKNVKLPMNEKKQLTKEETDAIKAEIQNLPQELVSSFEKYFKEWKATWFSGKFAFDSNPDTRKYTSEFDRLADMDTAIIPLVVDKLTEEDNFFALSLYEKLQRNPHLLVARNADDDSIMEGEQGRAYRTIMAYLRNR